MTVSMASETQGGETIGPRRVYSRHTPPPTAAGLVALDVSPPGHTVPGFGRVMAGKSLGSRWMRSEWLQSSAKEFPPWVSGTIETVITLQVYNLLLMLRATPP